jgi:ABC-type Mn2+/Zn2+ transport system permease subunit
VAAEALPLAAGALDWLAEPWQSGLMRRAFAEAVMAGLVCGALGCFLLVRRLTFLGESISHTVVLGGALSLALGVPLGLAGVLIAVATAGLTGAIASDRRFSPDTATGVLLPSLFAAGIVLLALSGEARHVEDLLFGAILGVGAADLALAGALVAATALTLGLAGKELELAAFDRLTARAIGLRVRVLDGLLLGLVAVTVVVGLRAVGALLLAGLLLGPPLAGRLLCRTFWPMVAVAATVASASGVIGLYMSWHLEVGAGPAIVLVITVGVAGAAAARRALRSRPPNALKLRRSGGGGYALAYYAEFGENESRYHPRALGGRGSRGGRRARRVRCAGRRSG